MIELLIVAAIGLVALPVAGPRTQERDAQADAEQEERPMRAAARAREDGGER